MEFGLPGVPNPGVQGATAEERIQKRRERIARRVAAEKAGKDGAAAAADDGGDGNAIDPRPVASMAKIADSQQVLEALKEGASDSVSLIRVTADLAETQKRAEEEKVREAARKRLEEDKIASEKEFSKILDQWEPAMAHTNAQDLKDALDAQREETNKLIAKKDALIETFREDLKKKDTLYVDELRCQASDVQTLLDTMSEQAKIMWSAYEKQLYDIEQTFLHEREDLLKQSKEVWDKHATNRVTTEEKQAFDRLKAIADHEERMEHLRITDHEEYLMVKEKLENDISLLEQQLEKMRATYQLNSEKLDYNYQVLKKRAEENSITISQQKRKISRMQDMMNALRTKIANQVKHNADENTALTEDYKRIADQFKELQKKFKHFQNLDQKQFKEVWTMNEDIAVELVTEILGADEVLMSQQLGLKWAPPDESALSSNVPDPKEENQGRQAAEVLVQVMGQDADDQENASVGDLPGSVIKKALLLLADECAYLIESKLLSLLDQLDEKQMHLMKLDAVFKGLGIETETELLDLIRTLVIPPDVGIETSEGITLNPEAYKLVNPNEVSDLVEEFVLELREQRGGDANKAEKSTFGIDAATSSDFQFWEQLPNVHSETHQRIWGVLDKGLNDYLKVLEDREQSLDMADQLRIQNEELKLLLQQYMAADVNRDLVIPPTMVLT